MPVKPRLVERVGYARDAWGAKLGETWNHARFRGGSGPASNSSWRAGSCARLSQSAQGLLQRARTAGGQAYPEADYDMAMAYFLMARVLQMAGGA